METTCNAQLQSILNYESQNLYQQNGNELETHIKERLNNLDLNKKSNLYRIIEDFELCTNSEKEILLGSLMLKSNIKQLSFVAQSLRPLLRMDFISYLPQNLNLKIFSFLDANSLCNTSIVSKKWNLISNMDSVWKKLCCQHINKKCTSCGWGLPPLLTNFCEKFNQPTNSCYKMDGVWKSIYMDRMVIERNWRKGNFKEEKIQLHGGPITCSHIHGNFLITGSTDKIINIMDIKKNIIISRISTTHTATSLHFDEQRLIVGFCNGEVKLYCYHTESLKRTFQCSDAAITSVHFENNLLVTSSRHRDIKVWNFQTSEMIHFPNAHSGNINQVHLFEGNMISSSEDHTLKLWNLQTRICAHTFLGHKNAVTSFKIINKTLISGSIDKTIKYWDLSTGKQGITLFGHIDSIISLQADSLRLVSSSNEGTVKVWDLQSGTLLHAFHIPNNLPVYSVNLTDTKIMAASHDGHLYTWNFE